MFFRIWRRYRAMRFFAIFLWLAVCIPVALSAQSARVEVLGEKLDDLIYRVQYDSAHQLVVGFLDSPDLTAQESFYGHYYYGRALRAGGRPEDAIANFQGALSFLDLSNNGEPVYRSAVRSQLAECYFDLLDFDRAAINAESSILLSPDTTIREAGHAINHLILGYVDYIQRRYEQALQHYKTAAQIYRSENMECELPLVTAKLAKLYHAMGQHAVAMQYLDSARQMSNACKIPRYIYLTERTHFDILKESGRFQEALDKYDEVSDILTSYQFQEKQRELELLETSYQNRLHVMEMQRMTEVNDANAAVLIAQRRTVLILVISLVLLLALVVFLLRENRLKNLALAKLNIFKDDLELQVAERTENLEVAGQQLKEKRDKLKSQNNRLVQLYHIMTHNLRAPLANMTMLIKFIQESDDPHEQKELVSKLPLVINALNANCSDLLDIIDTSAVDGEEEVNSIFIEDALLKVMRSLDAEIKAKNAVITYDFSRSEQVIYTQQYLESLFLNLLSNALKYSMPGRPPHIEILSEKEDDYLIITMTDNGLGLDLHKYGEALFKPQRTFHSNRDAKGYGLYMTKMQLENYGATIRMESTPDKGSTFYVRFKD